MLLFLFFYNEKYFCDLKKPQLHEQSFVTEQAEFLLFPGFCFETNYKSEK